MHLVSKFHSFNEVPVNRVATNQKAKLVTDLISGIASAILSGSVMSEYIQDGEISAPIEKIAVLLLLSALETGGKAALASRLKAHFTLAQKIMAVLPFSSTMGMLFGAGGIGPIIAAINHIEDSAEGRVFNVAIPVFSAGFCPLMGLAAQHDVYRRAEPIMDSLLQRTEDPEL